MNVNRKLFALAAVSICLAQLSRAAEKKISQANLPPAVQKAAQEHNKGATVKGYSQDNENGQLEYEMEMTVNGHSKDVAFSPDGSVLEVEEQAEMAALPASVQSGLKNKADKGSITKVESITKHGAIVAYEAQVRTMGKHSEIQVGPDGKPLDHEE